MTETNKWIISTFLILLAVILIAGSQIILKTQMEKVPTFPSLLNERALWVLSLFLNPSVVLVFICVFLSGLIWIIALTNVPLSYAYPFTSLTLPLILLLSYVFLEETLGLSQVLGTLLIVSGVIITSTKIVG